MSADFPKLTTEVDPLLSIWGSLAASNLRLRPSRCHLQRCDRKRVRPCREACHKRLGTRVQNVFHCFLRTASFHRAWPKQLLRQDTLEICVLAVS